MSEPVMNDAPVENNPTVEQEMRTLALQVAANRCDDVNDLIRFAAECEAYLRDGTVPQSE